MAAALAARPREDRVDHRTESKRLVVRVDRIAEAQVSRVRGPRRGLALARDQGQRAGAVIGPDAGGGEPRQRVAGVQRPGECDVIVVVDRRTRERPRMCRRYYYPDHHWSPPAWGEPGAVTSMMPVVLSVYVALATRWPVAGPNPRVLTVHVCFHRKEFKGRDRLARVGLLAARNIKVRSAAVSPSHTPVLFAAVTPAAAFTLSVPATMAPPKSDSPAALNVANVAAPVPGAMEPSRAQ